MIWSTQIELSWLLHPGQVFCLALAVDLVFGEPPAVAHPVVWTGKLIALFERLAPGRSPTRGSPAQELAFGAVMAVAVPFLCAALALVVLWTVRAWPLVELAVAVFLLKSSFSIRELGRAAHRVRDALRDDDLDGARYQLRSLCSRDASNLEASDLAGATVESVAENASDSFVAPVFYFALFGVAGAIFYRAVNTLDAMVGYRGQYEYVGKASARLDDVLNFIPARLTAGFLLCAGWMAGKDCRAGWTIMRRDGATTPSPNAGRPMATMAGLLHIQLKKPDHYCLGDPGDGTPDLRSDPASTIDDAWQIALSASLLFALVVALLSWVFYAGQ
ncbi:MAG: adenosylcobinamide-phosphate synthase CbiB [Proteobacteria bacterium]|nr:adenosylcobinamide-phosphate synthase CbiB [Pseudomonadota bacterium]